MREDEARRSRTPWRWHPWLKPISNAAAHVSAATLLVAGVANGLAARKQKNRDDDRDRRDQADKDENDGNDQNRGDKSGNDSKEDREHQREQKHRSDRDDDGGDANRSHKPERQNDDAGDVQVAQGGTPEAGGGGGGNGGGTNAGSGVFDNPLATKARRRANDFDNADRDEEDDRTFVDVDPDGESVYQTNSVDLITGPAGLEIVTNNITYVAEPTPTPEPLPMLELPARDPGFPFGEDFPFGDSTVAVAPTASEPPDPGDSGTTTDARAKFFPTQPEPVSDGGDNSMDFVS
jgi:hypothetical protein